MNFIKTHTLSFFIVSLLIYSVPAIAMQNNNEDLADSKNNLSIIIKRSSILDLPSCSIDDDFACKLAEALKGSQITQLNLNYNVIGKKGIKDLSQAFKTMKKLTTLNLYGNPIEDEGFSELFPALKEVKTLVLLDIRATKLGDTGAYMLADLLENNASLMVHSDLTKLSRATLEKVLKDSSNK